MAQKHRQSRHPQRKRNNGYPGWMWMLFGLVIGLSVAFAIYLNSEKTTSLPKLNAQQPASMAGPISASPPSFTPEASPIESEETEPRFSFYKMLPNFEVIIPEEETDVSLDNQIEAVQQPGIYVLQAGSFTRYADADRRKAQLALLGIESTVQRISIDDQTYHRVRIGPISNLEQLNQNREQLHQAEIEVLRIRVGD